MKIPKKINVFGVVYKIKFIDTDLFAGLCDPSKKTIFLNINQSKDQILSTYIHETIHAMQFSIGMNQAISRELMEIMAESTAVLVMDMISVK